MKWVFRLFLLFSVLLAGMYPESGSANVRPALQLPIASLAVKKSFHAIPGVERGEPGARIENRSNNLIPDQAFFEAEPETRSNPESNFSEKQAAVISLYATHFRDAAHFRSTQSPKCSPIRGHFSVSSRRFIALRVIRI